MIAPVSKKVQYVPQTLRDYQREAVDAVKNAWENGTQSPLVALATGAGKTTIASQLLVETVDPEIHRALVIGHTTEIVYQCRDRIANQFGGRLDNYYGGLRMLPGIGVVMGTDDMPDARIVVATRQSAHPQRLKRMLQTGSFDALVIDEAHHALADNTYGEIVETLKKDNPAINIVGMTATPARTDKKALKTTFDEIVYQWLIPDGVQAGYLTPVTRIKVKTKVDLSGVRSSNGDYSSNRMVSVLQASNWIDLSLKAFKEYIADSGRSCLAFLPSVEMSKQFTQAVNSEAMPAAHIDGTTPKDERRALLSDYASGKLKVISNMAVLTEGFDAPATSAIFLARPTRSKTLFTQIVGRGLRPFPGKDDCLLLDMTVVDTKALETGTLLGRIITCQQCETDYYFGMGKCPNCGAVLPPPEEKSPDDDPIPMPHQALYEGNGIVTSHESLFEKAFAAWYSGEDGYLSAALGFDKGALIIMPPIVDGYYRLAHVPTNGNEPVVFLDRNEDLASLMLSAEKRIDKDSRDAKTLQKDAKWRGEPATRAQKGLLRQLGVKGFRAATKGTAAQMITHTLHVKRAMNEAWLVE